MPQKCGYNRVILKSGTFYVVATPIGNYADLTLRARRILSECNAIVCEEGRVGSTLLAHFHLDKPLYEWNEHSELKESKVLLDRIQRGENLALVSDHGTPLIQDPGAELIHAAVEHGIRVEPIPGCSAILAALVASGIAAPRFRFLGRLPQKGDARMRALNALSEIRETMILVDTPYRLTALLKALCEAFGETRQAVVACNLTLPEEEFVRHTLGEMLEHFTAHPFKGEYVIVVEGTKKSVKKAAVK